MFPKDPCFWEIDVFDALNFSETLFFILVLWLIANYGVLLIMISMKISDLSLVQMALFTKDVVCCPNPLMMVNGSLITVQKYPHDPIRTRTKPEVAIPQSISFAK